MKQFDLIAHKFAIYFFTSKAKLDNPCYLLLLLICEWGTLGRGPNSFLMQIASKHSHTPGENHPWRQYSNKRTKPTIDGEEDKTPIMSLKDFLRDVVDNWDTYKIPPANFEDRDYISLARINPDKQAEWLLSFIKKHWLAKYKGALIFE